MRRWIGHALVTSAVGAACALAAAGAAISFPLHATAASRTTVWLQTLDGCRQAVPGGTFTLSGKNVSQTAGPASGTKPTTVDPTKQCPLQQGNCVTVPTGCVSWTVAVPASGSTTYVIRQSTAPTGYVGCTGGAACRDQFVQLTVESTGTASATVTNIYPDGTSVVWPSSGSYPGTEADPIVFHDFGGSGSCGSAPSSHCPGGSAVPATTTSSSTTPSSTSTSPSPSPTSTPAATAAATPASTTPPADPPTVTPASSQAVVQPSIPAVALPQPSFSEPSGMSGLGSGTGISALSMPTMPAMPTFPPMPGPSSVPAPSAAAAPATTGGTGGTSPLSSNLAAAGTGTAPRGDSVELLAIALAFTLALVGGAVAVRSRLLRHRSSE